MLVDLILSVFVLFVGGRRASALWYLVLLYALSSALIHLHLDLAPPFTAADVYPSIQKKKGRETECIVLRSIIKICLAST